MTVEGTPLTLLPGEHDAPPGHVWLDRTCEDASGKLIDARRVQASLVNPRMRHPMLDEMEEAGA